jgi:hypothetical protein
MTVGQSVDCVFSLPGSILGALPGDDEESGADVQDAAPSNVPPVASAKLARRMVLMIPPYDDVRAYNGHPWGTTHLRA